LREVYLEDTQLFSSYVPGSTGTIQINATAPAGTYQLRVFINDGLTENRVVTFGE